MTLHEIRERRNQRQRLIPTVDVREVFFLVFFFFFNVNHIVYRLFSL